MLATRANEMNYLPLVQMHTRKGQQISPDWHQGMTELV